MIDADSQTHEHHHHHSPVDDGNERRVFWAMILIGIFMFVEAIGGYISGSLALLADAGHMLTDFVALGLAWFAFRMARREADEKRTYGYHRIQVLAAFVNGILLILVSIWIIIEAVKRLNNPVEIMSTPMLIVAVIGLLVNIAAFVILSSGDQDNLNIRGAVLHVIGDILGSIAAIGASLVIMWTGWLPIDPILSVLVVLLILKAAWSLITKSAHILLEGAPDGLDPEVVKAKLVAAVPGVTDIHHFHAWSLTNELPVITLHASITAEADPDETLTQIHETLVAAFGLAHATIQIEQGVCPDEVVQP